MKKRTLRKLACIGAGLLLIGSLTGCTSLMTPQTGATAEKMELNKEELSELDLSVFHTEGTGYSYRGVKWGSTVEETETALGYSLGKGEALSSGTITSYKPESAAALILGKVCSNVEFAYNSEGELYSVTYQYMAGDDMDAAGLDEFSAGVVKEFNALFGEGISKESVTELRNGTMNSTIYKWEEEIENEQISSLQVAVSSMSDQTDMVIIGAICFDKSALEEETSGEGTE